MKLFKAMLCSVAALSLLLPAAHAQAAPTVVKIALTQPTGHPTTDLIRGQFKKTIEEKTNGRFRIDVFDTTPSATLKPWYRACSSACCSSLRNLLPTCPSTIPN